MDFYKIKGLACYSQQKYELSQKNTSFRKSDTNNMLHNCMICIHFNYICYYLYVRKGC